MYNKPWDNPWLGQSLDCLLNLLSVDPSFVLTIHDCPNPWFAHNNSHNFFFVGGGVSM